jgi:hypothetical protein
MKALPKLPPSQFRLFRLMVWRDYRAKFSYVWIYILATVILVITAFAVQSFYRSFETETVQIARDPLLPVHAVVVAALALSFGLRASASVSAERENRTLEVLLAGPVNMMTFVTAKVATELLALISLLVLNATYLLILQPLAGGINVLQGVDNMLRLAVYALPFVGFGLLISSALGSVRTAMIVFTVASLALISLDVYAAWLNVQNPNDLSLSTLYLKAFLQPVSHFLMWVSPASYLVGAVKSAVGVATTPASYPFTALACFFVLVMASCMLAARRGAT